MPHGAREPERWVDGGFFSCSFLHCGCRLRAFARDAREVAEFVRGEAARGGGGVGAGERGAKMTNDDRGLRGVVEGDPVFEGAQLDVALIGGEAGGEEGGGVSRELFGDGFERVAFAFGAVAALPFVGGGGQGRGEIFFESGLMLQAGLGDEPDGGFGGADPKVIGGQQVGGGFLGERGEALRVELGEDGG